MSYQDHYVGLVISTLACHGGSRPSLHLIRPGALIDLPVGGIFSLILITMRSCMMALSMLAKTKEEDTKK